MKISVKIEASETNGGYTFSLDDLGVTKDEWDSLSDDEKHEVVQTGVFDMQWQPYWSLVSFKERE